MLKPITMLAAAAAVALVASGANAQKMKGDKPFCLQSSATGGVMDCSYDNMNQCKKAAQGPGATCAPRPTEGGGKMMPKK